MVNEDMTKTPAPNSTPIPDPTVLTTKLLHHELKGIKHELDLRDKSREREHSTLQEVLEVRLKAIKRELRLKEEETKLREAHRLELKADNQRTVETAMVAAEKAVQAALAAAEKARDQQTIASQLATTKAEQASKEQMEQQGATFTLAISGLNTGVQDMKTMVGELRAEKKGGQEQVTERRATTTTVIAIASVFSGVLGAGIVAIITLIFGG